MNTPDSASIISSTNSDDENPELEKKKRQTEVVNYQSSNKLKKIYTAKIENEQLHTMTEEEKARFDAAPTHEDDIGIIGEAEKEQEEDYKNTPSSSNTQNLNPSNNRPRIRQIQTQKDIDNLPVIPSVYVEDQPKQNKKTKKAENEPVAIFQKVAKHPPNGEDNQLSNVAQPSRSPKHPSNNKVAPIGEIESQVPAETEDNDSTSCSMRKILRRIFDAFLGGN